MLFDKNSLSIIESLRQQVVKEHKKDDALKEIKIWFNKYYWGFDGWKVNFEKKRMHPDHDYLKNIVNKFE